jgi:hypothetical protein
MSMTQQIIKALWWLIGYQIEDLWRPSDGYRVPWRGLDGQNYLMLPLARYRRYRRRGGEWSRFKNPKEGFDAWAVSDEDGEILAPGPLTYQQAITYIWDLGGPQTGDAGPERLYSETTINRWGLIRERCYFELPGEVNAVISARGPTGYAIVPMSPWYRQSFRLRRLQSKVWRREYHPDGYREIRYSWHLNGVRMSTAPMRLRDAQQAIEHHMSSPAPVVVNDFTRSTPEALDALNELIYRSVVL